MENCLQFAGYNFVFGTASLTVSNRLGEGPDLRNCREEARIERVEPRKEREKVGSMKLEAIVVAIVKFFAPRIYWIFAPRNRGC